MDCFRKVFRAASIKKARLYMTAYGLYEAAINGQRVGDFVRAPRHYGLPQADTVPDL